MSKFISYSEARNIAEAEAHSLLAGYLSEQSKIEILSENYLKADHCWMFFRRKDLIFPPEASFAASAAYVVSKRGTLRTVADLSFDSGKLHAYLQSISQYFGLHE